MSITIRSEIKHWKGASKIEDCTENYISIPKKVISEAYNPTPRSIVAGKAVALSIEQTDDLIGYGYYSSVIRNLKLNSRIVIGQEDEDYLFIFQKDWNRLSKKFQIPGRKFLTYEIETLYVQGKKIKVYKGNPIYWEEHK